MNRAAAGNLGMAG